MKKMLSFLSLALVVLAFVSCSKNSPEGVVQEYVACIQAGQYEEAVDLFQKAADLGHSEAQLMLGMCYFNGDGIKRDYDEAVKWFRKAADQGNALAQYNLGVCYINGIGVNKDPAEAVKWYRKAAEQGYEPAEKALGKMKK